MMMAWLFGLVEGWRSNRVAFSRQIKPSLLYRAMYYFILPNIDVHIS